LGLGEALSAEAKRRPTEGGGKHPPEAKSFGKSSAEDLKRREMPPPPVTSYLFPSFPRGPVLPGPLVLPTRLCCALSSDRVTDGDASMTAANLAQSLLESARLRGDKPAILFDGHRLSFAQLDDRVRKAAAWLQGTGLQQGDRVALVLPKSLDFIFLHLAILSIGCVSLPLNPAYTGEEIRYFLSDSGSRLLITSHSLQERLGPAAMDMKDLNTALMDRGAPGLLGPVIDEMASVGPGDPRTYPTRGDDLALLCYTSGTTGRPKGAMISHRNLLSNMAALKQAWEWTEDDVLLHVLPLFHIHGLAVALHGAINAGSTIVMHERFDPVRAWRAMEGHRCTLLMGVPTMYYRLLDAWGAVRPDLGAVRLFICGSAPLSESLFTRFEEKTGYRILERYGMTETGMITSNPLDPARRKANSVGYPLPGVSLRVVSQGGEDVAPGEAGEVWVRGDSVFKGYWGAPGKTEEAFVQGWFRSGDLGYQDPGDDLRLYLLGRSRELIITAGYNVYPKEVEAALERHDLVKEAAVLGIPDEEFGEKVAAVVVPRGDRAELRVQELLDFCRRQLAPYKCPRVIIPADELPRNAMGKVQKHALLERFKA